MAESASTSPWGTLKSSSSCTWMSSFAAKPSSRNLRDTSIIASLIISAADPCMGWFIAVRSPNPRRFALPAWSSGMWRLRPNIVSAYPRSRAFSTVASRYARTPG